MKKNQVIKPFYVIIEDVNKQEFVKYDVMKFLVNEYNEAKPKDKPITRTDFTEFVENKSRYMYWARCQYEILCVSWPCENVKKKIDVHWQIENNIDTVVDILMYNVGK